MTEASNTSPALAPHLVCDGASDAIEFYKKAFDAKEIMRLPGPDGRLMHGAVSINGAQVMLATRTRPTGCSRRRGWAARR